MKTVLTIAGYDPSSGAGVTADLMVFAAHGLYGTSCITSLTVQSTLGVRSSHATDADVIRATLDCLHEDLPPAGIKVGMLASAETVEVVAAYLERYPEIPVVLDPVMQSTSGRELLSMEGVELLRRRLVPLVDWITPNLDELGMLTGRSVTTREEAVRAARKLQPANPRLRVLVTGGHLDRPDDLLVTLHGTERWLPGERVETQATHGTGCALSSALLCRIVMGDQDLAAAGAAKDYVVQALRASPVIGHGKGPMNHLWPIRKFSSAD